MSKKTLWLLVSGLMTLSLVLTACAPATTPAPTTPAQTTPTPTTPQVQQTPQAPTVPVKDEPRQETVSPEKPKYGGTVNLLNPSGISTFGAAVRTGLAGQVGYVLENILGVDRTKGPAGTGEVDFAEGPTSFNEVVGLLADKWATPEVGVWVLDIRRGVHFAFNPNSEASRLVNGREMTAEDVAFSIEYLRDTPWTWVNLSEPGLIKNTTVERTGPWQITVRTPVSPTTAYLWIMGGGSQYVWPKEMLQKYGTSNAWQDQVGTGPYILTDYVPDSAGTYKRNPNYWAVNPVGPGKGDKLPYADRINYLIVPDYSTRLAALRTGKGDWMTSITREDGLSLMKTNPKIKSYRMIIDGMDIALRQDRKDLPYHDIRVRHALMMATDMEGMKRDLYGGQAEILDSPARILFKAVYIPMEQLPASVQELYTYNPEKAKQLLKEAGYPNGFKANVIVQNTTSAIDVVAVVKDMWAKVGVDLEIQPKEGAVYSNIFRERAAEEMFAHTGMGSSGSLGLRYGFIYFRGTNSANQFRVDDPPGTDPVIEAAYQRQATSVMVDWAEADRAYRDVIPYILEQAWYIPTPAPYGYRMWQPWLKDYYGESAAKYWLQYIWVDQDLKQQMTGRR